MPYSDHDFSHGQFLTKHGSYTDIVHDIGETDSAFSENASLPSSESFTSMVTVSSTADTGDAGSSASSASTVTPLSTQASEMHELMMSQLSLYQEELEKENFPPEEQKARLKAEKIRIALEKIKEAKIRKLFVRAFAKDGSSKSILVDEKMLIGQVCTMLADKNHVRINSKLAVVEHMPDLHMERILEDHDSLVENMVMWTRDSKNKILFEERQEKFDLFRCPEKYLLVGSSSEKGASLDPGRRQRLVQEFFNGGAQVPEVEGVLYLKSEGKKAWKKFYFVLRASGLYYNPKGKISKSSKDLTCLVQFDFVDVYHGLMWKKKYHSPTDYCFALKHPQIQKKASKYIRYFCAENKAALDQWVIGIRIAKYGRQLLRNYEQLQRQIASWDTRDIRSSVSDEDCFAESIEFNPDGNLSDSRLSMPEPGSRHSVVCVKNSTLIRNSSSSDTTITENSDEIVCLEVTAHHSRQSSLSSQQSMDSIAGGQVASGQKAPVKRVSFSNTHSVINDSGEELVPLKHRDSITSASTDSSEDSTSSGESRQSFTSHRGRLKAKIPVTTETTRQISGMYQQSMETSSISSCDSGHSYDRKSSLTSPIHSQSYNDKERRKSAPVLHSGGSRESRHERKSSDTARESKTLSQAISASVCDPQSTKVSSVQSPQPSSKSPLSPPPVKSPPQQPAPIPTQSSQKSIIPLPTSPPPVSRERALSPPPLPHVPPNITPEPKVEPVKTNQVPVHPGPSEVLSQRERLRTPPPPPPHSHHNAYPVPPPVAAKPAKPTPKIETYNAMPPLPPPEDKSPPPPMPPPGQVTKPPSPSSLSLSHPSSKLPPPPPVRAQGSVAPTMPLPTPPVHSQSPGNSSNTDSSPSTPKGMIPMPPPMPLLQNQYVGEQSPASGHVRRSSKTGSDTGSPAKGPVPVAPPSAPGMNHMVTSPTSKIPKHIPPSVSMPNEQMLCSPTGRNPTSPTVMSPVPPHTYYVGGGQCSVVAPPPQCGYPMEMYDQIRVRPGPQARTNNKSSNKCSSAAGTVRGHVKQSSGDYNSSANIHSIQKPSFSNEAETDNTYAQGPLPFLAELSKRTHVGRGSNGKIPPATLPKPLEGGGGHKSQNSHGALQVQHGVVSPNGPIPSKSHSSSKKSISDGRKLLPPPPPKRSESTRLSAEVKNTTYETLVPKSDKDPIYETFDECDVFLDVNDLPPPPPELLMGLSGSGADQVVPTKKGKPPPAPPKRSHDTHLTSQ
ncbi:hypothetical protein KUTeg_008599 [Tegillarca granosa]|uniref:Ras-associated and pleckstrin homology domains-containing protein 1 n=1 Tax=Tegillarca granosa TaxID=220873 RepID=A0ABQ9FEF3_TEGGR|nr:hypothetical protein KUTeg_008599 [Tegillarca granosa]